MRKSGKIILGLTAGVAVGTVIMVGAAMVLNYLQRKEIMDFDDLDDDYEDDDYFEDEDLDADPAGKIEIDDSVSLEQPKNTDTSKSKATSK